MSLCLNWKERSSLPRFARAAMQALQFDGAGRAVLQALDEAEWRDLLAFTDRMKVTLELARRHGGALPEWVRERTARDLAGNRERWRKLWSVFDEIEASFRSAGIPYVVLKGFTHGEDYIAPSWLRHQCDLDLYHPPAAIGAAREALEKLGFEPVAGYEGFPMDHLPAMARKSDHEWRGDYFDPRLPVVVEPHFQWWDRQTERIAISGLDVFWERRTWVEVEGRRVPALAPCDRFTYAALHALRHLLRGDLRAFHLYELAAFLHRRAADDLFWEEWAATLPAAAREPALATLELARIWFGCGMAKRLEEETARLPEPVRAWLRDHAAAPVESLFRPNKDELWLHLALLPPDADRWPVIRRKILPATLPGPVAGAYPGEGRKSPLRRARERIAYAAHIGRRLVHHLRATSALASRFFRPHDGGAGLPGDFWAYLGAATAFHLGVFIFVLLYNLRLSELGLDEGFIGVVAAAMTGGSIAGAFAAGWLTQRLGLRASLLTCFCGIPAVAAVRTVATGQALLLGSAVAAGMLFSLWVVCIAPVVAGLVREEHRTRAFSIFFASSIAVGFLGGFLGGRLHGALAAYDSHLAGFSPLQAAILAGCALTASALVPAARIRSLPQPVETRLRYPRGPFVQRFLPALFLWGLATGAFNPFYNVYAVRHLGLSVTQTGDLFAAGQLAQVAAILAAPLLFRLLGWVTAIAALQAAAGGGLALMALRDPLWAPCAAYLLYMSFQWMTEPGLHSLVMSRVEDGERSGASSLMYVTTFAAHAAAAAVAGAAIPVWTYSRVLFVAAGVAVLAAAFFRVGLAPFERRKADSEPDRAQSRDDPDSRASLP